MSIREQARAEAEKRMPGRLVELVGDLEYNVQAARMRKAFVEGAVWAATRTRVVTTVTELDALPVGSVVRVKHLSYIKYAPKSWIGARNSRVDSVTLSCFAPLAVLYDPED